MNGKIQIKKALGCHFKGLLGRVKIAVASWVR